MNSVMYDTENPKSNIVSGDVSRNIKSSVLRTLKDAIIHSMGPAGSNTMILKGSNSAEMTAEYTKDGNKIIKSILFSNPIEMAIQTEMEEITTRVERIVGDGTSSAVILSSILFDLFVKEFANDHQTTVSNPYHIMREFEHAVEAIKKQIIYQGRGCTLDDIYNITYISTNGNDDLADQMTQIYEKYGMDVFIDVSASTNGNSYIGEYDGLTIDVGYSDPAYINTGEGVSRLHNPHIYSFDDSIDTPTMGNFMEKIILENVMMKIGKDGSVKECIPTVIMAPRISRDKSSLIRRVVEMFHSYGDAFTQKPPLLIITNIAGESTNIYQNIAQLCGCKPIKKYIDPEMEKSDQENGSAPTLENITEFYGTCELLESDAVNSKFVNPSKMYKKKEDGSFENDSDGKKIFTETYISLVTYLEVEMNKALSTGNEIGVAASLKRQLNALKCNMVEFYVGGVSVSDRDAKRDLVEDAVLNCRSAAANGVGYGANYEGLRAVMTLLKGKDYKDNLYMGLILKAYREIITTLYASAYNQKQVESITFHIFDADEDCGPYNITTGKFDKKVLSSIMSDVVILDTVMKIIGIMFTSNQTIIQNPNINMYC